MTHFIKSHIPGKQSPHKVTAKVMRYAFCFYCFYFHHFLVISSLCTSSKSEYMYQPSLLVHSCNGIRTNRQRGRMPHTGPYSFPKPFSILDACVILGAQISSGELGWGCIFTGMTHFQSNIQVCAYIVYYIYDHACDIICNAPGQHFKIILHVYYNGHLKVPSLTHLEKDG